MPRIQEQLQDMTVLLVDDEPIIRRWIEAQIRGLGLRILHADNGAMGLHVIDTENPDLVLLDGVMPIMDGFETCLRIKGDPLRQHLPVIMLTALKGPAKDRAYECGADDFLNKPPHAEELRGRIMSHLRLTALKRRRVAGDSCLPLEVPERPRVLLVMEDREARQDTSRILQGQGMEVRTLGHLKGVPEFLAHESPDLLILSDELPDGDSQAFCAKLRNFDITRDIPVILVVTEASLESPIRWFDAGKCDLLVKPFDPQELSARVQSLLRQGRLAREQSANGSEAGYTVLLDPRTGLPGRPFFEAHLRVLCGLCVSQGLPLSLAWVRYPREARWGQEGQRTLQDLTRLKAPLQEGQTLCRLGQHLFVYLLPGISGVQAKGTLGPLFAEDHLGVVEVTHMDFVQAMAALAGSLKVG